jgi:hypothetical protein
LHQNRLTGRNLYDIDNIAFLGGDADAVLVAADLSALDNHGVH